MCALGAQKNHLIQTVLMSTHNIMFRLRNKKNNFQLCILIWRPECLGEVVVYKIPILATCTCMVANLNIE